MIEWAVAIIIFLLGYTVGRSFRQTEVIDKIVTTKVTDPMDELMRHDWLAHCEPIIHQLEVGAMFGSGTTYNRDGSKALAELISEMATKLDYARHISRKLKERA